MDPIASGEIQCHVGDAVVTADDHKIGKVAAVDGRYLTVEHGLLHRGDYFVPREAVNTCNDRTVYLNATRDQVKALGWDAPPALPTEADGGVLHS